MDRYSNRWQDREAIRQISQDCDVSSEHGPIIKVIGFHRKPTKRNIQQQPEPGYGESKVAATLQDPSLPDHLDEQIQGCFQPQRPIRKLDIAR